MNYVTPVTILCNTSDDFSICKVWQKNMFWTNEMIVILKKKAWKVEKKVIGNVHAFFLGLINYVTPVTSLVLHVLLHTLTPYYKNHLNYHSHSLSVSLDFAWSGIWVFLTVIFLFCMLTFIPKTSLVLQLVIDTTNQVVFFIFKCPGMNAAVFLS